MIAESARRMGAASFSGLFGQKRYSGQPDLSHKKHDFNRKYSGERARPNYTSDNFFPFNLA